MDIINNKIQTFGEANKLKTSDGCLELQQALMLHQRVLASGQLAYTALVDFCKNLKEMRDTKGYEQLGHEDFGDYVEAEVNIKRRQAYNYIKTYETLGPQVLAENAKLGITKLELLTQVPALDRNAVLEENNLSDMTVDEVNALVKKLQDTGEQLTLLQDMLKEKDGQITALSSAPLEAVATEVDTNALGKLRAELEADSKAKIEKVKNAALKKEEKLQAVIEAAEQEQAAAVAEAVDKTLVAAHEKAEAEQEELRGRAEALQKQLKLEADPETAKFSVYFAQLQDVFGRMQGIIVQFEQSGAIEDNEKAATLKGALQRGLAHLAGQVE